MGLFKRLFKRKRPLPDHLKRGYWGEAQAARFLKKKRRFKILVRNWHDPTGGELDLVMKSPEGILVFVEVRVRAMGALVGPFHSLSAAKRRLFKRAGHHYLRAIGRPAMPHRFDMVALSWRGDSIDIQHYENVMEERL